MKKSIYFIIITIFTLFAFTGCSNNDENKNVSHDDSARAAKLNANITLENTDSFENTVQNEIHLGAHEQTNEPAPEQDLASFSTKLGGKNTPRSRNIGITTSTLNETIVKNGETFSFCQTLGKPTADRGYEEADSFDKDGNTVKTLGGGNCQVSSTLYNVVLQIPELKVTERHAHVKPVHYVAKDKDATVSYGSVDFKFKNNTGSDIKIYANSDLSSVNIRIVEMGQ